MGQAIDRRRHSMPKEVSPVAAFDEESIASRGTQAAAAQAREDAS